ncbi:MAG: M28 family peptidase [Gemmatimonadales bacterium]
MPVRRALIAVAAAARLLGAQPGARGVVMVPHDTFALSAVDSVPGEANRTALFTARYRAPAAEDSIRTRFEIQLVSLGSRGDTLVFVRGAPSPTGAKLAGYEAMAQRVGRIGAGETLRVVLRPPPQFPRLDSARLMGDIAALAADSMEGRKIGTAGGARARAFLLRAFKEIGLEAPYGGFANPFVTRQGKLRGTNIIGLMRGVRRADRYLIVSAHYDHLGVRNGVIYNGADDNASGTAAVLAIARWFRVHPPAHSIVFVLFDGEEEGLLGAREFVATPPVPLGAILADVNLDMVSRNVKGELYAAGASVNPAMKPLLDSIAAVAPVKLLLGHDTGIGESNWIQQSDQGVFAARKIPFVYFGVEDHPDYHGPGDKVERIQPGFYYGCARTIAEFVRRLDLYPVATARR